MASPVAKRPVNAGAARASGRSVTASRSTPTSASRRTTTGSTPACASSTSTRTADSPASTRTDLRGRFRWLGLYTQRKPGIDGGRTAILEPHELDDEYFMLRIRIDGGQLNVAQLAGDRERVHAVRPRHR